jgi:hypothetical protein
VNQGRERKNRRVLMAIVNESEFELYRLGAEEEWEVYQGVEQGHQKKRVN